MSNESEIKVYILCICLYIMYKCCNKCFMNKIYVIICASVSLLSSTMDINMWFSQVFLVSMHYYIMYLW